MTTPSEEIQIQPESTPPGEPNPSSTGKMILKGLWEIAQTLILALVLYFLIDAVIARVRVDKISMEPTLEPGYLLLVNRLAYRFDTPKTGDIVIFHYPGNPSEDYVKRVIGVPGDTVKVDGGVVYVNRRALAEDYIMANPNYNGEWIVPTDSVFVLGDNRNQSSDSHEWGFVPYDMLVGKALAIYWPFNEIKILSQTRPVMAAP